MHYGVGHDKGGHSGRYPWGSGDNPYGGTGKKKVKYRDIKKIANIGLDIHWSQFKNDKYRTSKGTEMASSIYNKLVDYSGSVKDPKWNDNDELLKDFLKNRPDAVEEIHKYKSYHKDLISKGQNAVSKLSKKYDLSSLYDDHKYYFNDKRQIIYFGNNPINKYKSKYNRNLNNARDFIDKYANQYRNYNYPDESDFDFLKKYIVGGY